jgi:hypothetical protein
VSWQGSDICKSLLPSFKPVAKALSGILSIPAIFSKRLREQGWCGVGISAADAPGFKQVIL